MFFLPIFSIHIINMIDILPCSLERERERANTIEKEWPVLKERRIRFTWAKKPVEDEYNLAVYQAFIHKLKTAIPPEFEDWFSRVCCFFHLHGQKIPKVEITQYGAMGSYYPNHNMVTINIHINRDPVLTIKHEILHLILHDYIEKYHLRHDRKEKIVNSLNELLGE